MKRSLVLRGSVEPPASRASRDSRASDYLPTSPRHRRTIDYGAPRRMSDGRSCETCHAPSAPTDRAPPGGAAPLFPQKQTLPLTVLRAA